MGSTAAHQELDRGHTATAEWDSLVSRGYHFSSHYLNPCTCRCPWSLTLKHHLPHYRTPPLDLSPASEVVWSEMVLCHPNETYWRLINTRHSCLGLDECRRLPFLASDSHLLLKSKQVGPRSKTFVDFRKKTNLLGRDQEELPNYRYANEFGELLMDLWEIHITKVTVLRVHSV